LKNLHENTKISILLKLIKGNKWTNKDIYLRGHSKIECLGEKKAMSYAFKLNLTTPQQGLDKDRALWSRDRDRPLYDSVLLSGNLTIVLGFVVRVEGFQEDDGIYLWIVICDSRRRFFCDLEEDHDKFLYQLFSVIQEKGFLFDSRERWWKGFEKRRWKGFIRTKCLEGKRWRISVN
jgi:hypothetical protein